jgi:threonine-phosphate decarboxylase
MKQAHGEEDCLMTEAHGGDIWAAARSAGIAPGDLVDFSASINPLGMSRKAVRAVQDSLGHIVSAYPDPASVELTGALSKYHALPPGNILPGNGSTEFISLIPRVLNPKNALIVEPAFSEYRKALRLSGVRVTSYTLKEVDGFMPDIKRLKAELESGGHDLLYIANPANPTGAAIERDKLAELAGACAFSSTMLVVDEAFCDFAEELSVKEEVLRHDNLIVLRSMTKFFAMAGLRLGLIFAHQKTIARFREHKPPWSVNTPAGAAAVASLKDAAYMQRTFRLVERERRFLTKKISKIKGVKLFPTAANFFMLKITDPNLPARVLKERLLKEGILIRDLSDFHGLGPAYLRIAVRTRRENKLLLDALSSALEKA